MTKRSKEERSKGQGSKEVRKKGSTIGVGFARGLGTGRRAQRAAPCDVLVDSCMGFVDLCMDFDKLHREESGRILATLIRLAGRF